MVGLVCVFSGFSLCRVSLVALAVTISLHRSQTARGMRTSIVLAGKIRCYHTFLYILQLLPGDLVHLDWCSRPSWLPATSLSAFLAVQQPVLYCMPCVGAESRPRRAPSVKEALEAGPSAALRRNSPATKRSCRVSGACLFDPSRCVCAMPSCHELTAWSRLASNGLSSTCGSPSSGARLARLH